MPVVVLLLPLSSSMYDSEFNQGCGGGGGEGPAAAAVAAVAAVAPNLNHHGDVWKNVIRNTLGVTRSIAYCHEIHGNPFIGLDQNCQNIISA